MKRNESGAIPNSFTSKLILNFCLNFGVHFIFPAGAFLFTGQTGPFRRARSKYRSFLRGRNWTAGLPPKHRADRWSRPFQNCRPTAAAPFPPGAHRRSRSPPAGKQPGKNRWLGPGGSGAGASGPGRTATRTALRPGPPADSGSCERCEGESMAFRW